jgi:pyruvate,orthophosphate dikinase
MFNEGRGDMRSLLGGKDANLTEMTNIGLPCCQGWPLLRKVVKNTIMGSNNSR